MNARPGPAPVTASRPRAQVSLTLMQRRYLKYRRAEPPKTKYAAARAAGYSHEVATNAKQCIESRRAVREALARWLEREGLSDRALGLA